MSSDIKLSVEDYHSIREDIEDYLRKRKNKETKSAYELLDLGSRLKVLLYAKNIRKKAELIEGDITKDVKELVSSGGCELKSLQHRLKSLNRLVEKITANSKDYDGSFSKAADKIGDYIRYTIIIEDNLYKEKVDEYLNRFESLGYEVVTFKNFWDNPEYKGINVKLYTKDKKGVFELQFHTQFSYQIKEGSTRDLYLVMRDIEAPDWLKIKANRLRIFLQSCVNIPQGIIGYEYNSCAKRR